MLAKEHLHMLDLILEELYEKINSNSVDTYYKPTIDYCKELIEKENK